MCAPLCLESQWSLPIILSGFYLLFSGESSRLFLTLHCTVSSFIRQWSLPDLCSFLTLPHQSLPPPFLNEGSKVSCCQPCVRDTLKFRAGEDEYLSRIANRTTNLLIKRIGGSGQGVGASHVFIVWRTEKTQTKKRTLVCKDLYTSITTWNDDVRLVLLVESARNITTGKHVKTTVLLRRLLYSALDSSQKTLSLIRQIQVR